jgi:S-adenosylmethionine hydrolase
MSIITLLTDFGTKEHFVAILKAKILQTLPQANIIDITHQVDKFNTLDACYLLQVSFHQFPENTIHIVSVDASVNADTNHVVMQYQNQYFIGADNGIFGNILQGNAPQKLITLPVSTTHETDIEIFAKTAVHIANGKKISDLGEASNSIKKLNVLQPNIDINKKYIKGNFIYIDDFGNCVSNITKKMITEVFGLEKPFVKFSVYTIKSIKNHYADFKNNTSQALKSMEGTETAVYNQAGFLEIAIYRSNPKRTGAANTLLGIKIHDVIILELDN